MSLITGTPVGNLISSQQLYLDTPPTFYFQHNTDASGNAVGLLNDPDGDSFYWGLSGTTNNPVYEGGCYEGFQIADGREVNMIRCDTEGDRGSIQKRTSLQITFTLKEFFKFTKLRHMLNWGAVTTNAGANEKVGIGQIDNSLYYYLYFPSIYDATTGDHVTFTAHRAQFTAAWTISFTYGQPATVGIQATCFADTNKPTDQQFATVIRADPSAT